MALEEERKDIAAGAKYPALLMVASDMERERRDCGKNCEWSMSDLGAINAIGPYVLIFRQMVIRALRDGEYGRAAIFASEVLRFSVHPEWGMRTQRGTARQMMNDMKGAEADAQAALELEPSYQPAMVLMQTIPRVRDSSGKSGARTPH